MVQSLKNSKTKENLMKAFAGESQARNRYTFGAELARKQGLYAIEKIFLFTAEQERAHAERFYELLKEMTGETIEIHAGYPIDDNENIIEALKAAQHNEFEEADDVYQVFAETAKEEGFLEVASAFIQIAEVEKLHGRRFSKIARLLEDGTYFRAAKEGKWMCLNCGHIHSGGQTPEICPLCRHEKGYFIPLSLAPYTGTLMGSEEEKDQP